MMLTTSVRLALGCTALLLVTSAAAQTSSHIIESVDVVRTPAHIDVSLLFGCRIRYVMHTPSGVGSDVRIRVSLGPDCGSLAQTQTVQPPSDREVVNSIEVVPLLASDVDVSVHWRREEKFVLLPTGDQRGLRVRLLRPGREAAGSRVVISEPAGDLTTAFAINLESARKPFDPQALETASERLKMPVYVSEVDIDGVHWHRLRLGPIATRSAAERKLLEAQAVYPRAWLAVQDEVVVEGKVATPPPLAPRIAPPDPPKAPAAQRSAQALYEKARERFRRKDYDQAIELLTKLLSQPFPRRAEALEMLGLARERNGQLAHAKAEYEAFLREFPDEPNANRVRRRLHALRTAALAARTGGAISDDETGWRVFGGVSQFYRRDDTQIENEAASNDFTSQNALINDIDVVARHRGLDYETVGRISAGYIHDLLPDGPGNQVRVSSAFVELADRDRGWSGRLGRQSRTSGGLAGTFDGMYGTYPIARRLIVDAAVGFPVESSRYSVDTDRMFESLSVGFGVFDDAWEPSVYLVNQSYDGEIDRQAVGVELRYFRPGRVVVGFADYDVHFQELNNVVAIGTFQAPWQWTVNLDLEHRKSPMLTTRNALIGQSVASLDELLGLFTSEEIQQLALDRSADFDIYGITLTRPIGERLQFTLNAASLETGATIPSGGVEGIPSTGPELVLSTQLLASSVMRTGDINIIALRHQSGGLIETSSVGISSRVPIWGDWRIGPQLRVDHRLYTADDTTQILYAPSLRLSLQKPKLLIELEGGAELTSRELAISNTNEDVTRYFVLLGYRYMF